MKKLLILTSLISFLTTANASAKTEGNYVGLNFIDTASSNQNHNSNFGLGADYKYAFNFGGLFLAPGVFYDYNRLSQPNSPTLKYSYGAKLNIGYDVTDKFAPFVTVGASQTRIQESAKNGMLLGVGFKYALNSDVDFTAAYEMTQFGLAGKAGSVIDGTDKINATYRVAKVGATYHF